MAEQSQAKIVNIGVITSLADLQAVQDTTIERFFVGDWNKEVFLRVPSALHRGKFEQLVAGVKGRPDVSTMKMRLVSMSLCDEEGKLLVPEQEKAAKYLGELSSVAIEQISQRVLEISKITAEEIDIAEKN